ncbi:MAG TPA: ArsA family ATPase [Vicinamibacterales bacterium]|nr:ArsA family ATPase [Vicinamibacterales bacterium]
MLLTLIDRRVIFFGGKGGVGKTTCSAAYALAASERGKRVLLVSADPAHSTADIFQQPIGAEPRQLSARLWALEINPDRESRRYVEQVKRDMEKMFSPTVVERARKQIDLAAASPGLGEVALLDRMIDLIVSNDAAPSRWDLIVFDTAPTGHTLQLLRMPEAMTTWIQALVRHRRAMLRIDHPSQEQRDAAASSDPVLSALDRRYQRLVELRSHVSDRGRTSFVLVTIPERLAIDETARAADALRETGLDVGALVVNRVLPEGLSGSFYEARKAQEDEYLDEISRRFARLPRVLVRQLPRDVHGTGPLATVAEQLLPS